MFATCSFHSFSGKKKSWFLNLLVVNNNLRQFKAFPTVIWAIVLQDVGILNTLAKQPVSVLMKLIKTKAAYLGVTGSL